MRQCPDRYTIRAGRNLPDKEFRYLRTVIVTAAVYRGFNSMLSHLLLTFRHRAGVSPYTSSFDLAETCVFAKQSPGPILCGSFEHSLFRSYGVNLPSSLTTLLPLALEFSSCPPVSVCGTGRRGFETLRRFSRRHGTDPFPPAEAGGPRHASGRRTRHLTRVRPARLDRPIQRAAGPPFRVTPSLSAPGPGMLTRSPSATRFRLALGAD